VRFDEEREITLRINGSAHVMVLEPRVTLLDALRDRLGLTGTKMGCDRGECGACTVHVAGRRVLACMTLAVAVADAEVTTIEGLAADGELHPMQRAFLEHDAFQCGYCTPGQVMSATALIAEGHTGSADEIRAWMSGNICRCAAYPQIVAALMQVVGEGVGGTVSGAISGAGAGREGVRLRRSAGSCDRADRDRRSGHACDRRGYRAGELAQRGDRHAGPADRHQ
jgi:xanthine dehydrogenase YagT iron-sulfur-binding subunit